MRKRWTSLGEDQVTVVGQAWNPGALALASERPELVSSLVLISGYYYPTARLDVAFAAPPAVPVIGDVMRYTVSPLLGAALKPAAEKQMFAPAKVPAKWRTKFPFEMTLRPSQIRASAADAALIVPAAASAAGGYPVSTPVHDIAGEGDCGVNPEDHASRWAARSKAGI